MACRACSASFLSVIRMSSSMRVSPLGLHPRQHFCLTETPVFSKPVTWYSPQGSLARASVDPRHGHLQQVRHFMNSKEVVYMSFFAPCGRGVCGIVRRTE